MHYLSSTYFLLVCCMFCSCAPKNKEQPSVSSKKKISKSVFSRSFFFFEKDHQDIEEIYIDAKWRSYCMFCDSTIDIPGLSKLTVGQTGLYLWDVRLDGCGNNKRNVSPIFFSYKGDTLLEHYLNYLMYSKNDWKHSYRPSLTAILTYRKDEKVEPVCYSDGSSFTSITRLPVTNRFYKTQKRSRLLYPLQPEVINYIRKNAATIDPWFWEQAKKRGAFDTLKYPNKWVYQQVQRNKELPQKDWIWILEGGYY